MSRLSDLANCPNCQQPVDANVDECPACGIVFPIVEASINKFAAPVALEESRPGDQGYQSGDENPAEAISYVVPYKNPRALISYYLGIASGMPFIGLPLGIAAFVLGIMGLRDRSRDPKIRGSVHAGIGIGCGGFFTVLWILVILALLMAG